MVILFLATRLEHMSSDKFIRILSTFDALQDLDGLDCRQEFDTAVDEEIFKIAQDNPTDSTRRALSATLRSIPWPRSGPILLDPGTGWCIAREDMGDFEILNGVQYY